MRANYTAKYSLRLRRYQFKHVNAHGRELYLTTHGTTQLQARSKLCLTWQKSAVCIGRYEVSIPGKCKITNVRLKEGQVMYHLTLEELLNG
jgi:hypothetical protein